MIPFLRSYHVCVRFHFWHTIANPGYVLCPKYEFGQSVDCPAQTSDPSFAQPTPGLSKCSPTRYLLQLGKIVPAHCSMCFPRWSKCDMAHRKHSTKPRKEVKSFLSGATLAKDVHFKFWFISLEAFDSWCSAS